MNPVTTKPILKGTVVWYQGGWLQVRAKFKTTVNLGPIFGSHTALKRVPLSEVKEDHDAWYAQMGRYSLCLH